MQVTHNLITAANMFITVPVQSGIFFAYSENAWNIYKHRRGANAIKPVAEVRANCVYILVVCFSF